MRVHSLENAPRKTCITRKVGRLISALLAKDVVQAFGPTKRPFCDGSFVPICLEVRVSSISPGLHSHITSALLADV